MIKQKQTVTKTPGHPFDDESYEHPAQGCVTVNKMTSSDGITLFGSNLKHRSVVQIEVWTAKGARGLHEDRHSQDRVICQFEFSEAQWASFVSSIGMGGGVACTFTYKPADGYKLEHVPRMETTPMTEKFSQEIADATGEKIKELYAMAQRIEILSKASSKAGLADLIFNLRVKLGNLPSNMGFIQKQFGEAMHNTVEAGKAEIEAFTRNTLTRAGMKHLEEKAAVTLIEGDKPKGDAHE
jgi:hypothetical protein